MFLMTNEGRHYSNLLNFTLESERGAERDSNVTNCEVVTSVGLSGDCDTLFFNKRTEISTRLYNPGTLRHLLVFNASNRDTLMRNFEQLVV